MINHVTASDEADWLLLRLANEKGKFGLDIRGVNDATVQAAFERGIDEEWFTLVDVAPIAHAAPGLVMRIFRLTATGLGRRDDLRSVFKF